MKDDNLQFLNVESSNLKAVAYDQKEKKLYVTFTSGATYAYIDVPMTIYGGLLAAESHGKYLNSNIKNIFQYEKVS